jgi:predicted Zn-dependent protease
VAENLASAAGAAAPAALATGRYDLALWPAALVGPAMEGWGWFAPLVAHAAAGWVRLGLSRYRPGQPVFGPDRGGDRFTLASDGTVPFGERSAPFGELGEPVRRFELVEDGVAAELALDAREAALAGASPNGGVRNLALGRGASHAAALLEPGARPLIEVSSLAWLEVDPRSGDVAGAIENGTRRDRGAAGAAGGAVAVAGGVLAGNLFELLGRARLASETMTERWYRGPALVRIDDVAIVQ